MKYVQIGSLTLTEDEARRAGLLPEQQAERFVRNAAALARAGQRGTMAHRALAAASRRATEVSR